MVLVFVLFLTQSWDGSSFKIYVYFVFQAMIEAIKHAIVMLQISKVWVLNL